MAVVMILSSGMIGSSNSLTRLSTVPLALTLLAALVLLAACERDPEADLAAGIEAYQDDRYREAYNYWNPHAQDGHVASMARVALLYSSGHGVEKNAERAVAHFTPAADAGLPLGTYLKALHTMQGEGLPEDDHSAFELLEPLIACKMPAALNLGGFALSGHTAVAANEEQAANWYREAAALGFEVAQFNHALDLLEAARGELELATDGFRWMILSHRNGHHEATKFLDRLQEDGLPEIYFMLGEEKADMLEREIVRIDPYGCSSDS